MPDDPFILERTPMEEVDDQITDQIMALFHAFRMNIAEGGDDIDALTAALETEILDLVERPIAALMALQELGIDV
jgi:hypothetical protein